MFKLSTLQLIQKIAVKHFVKLIEIRNLLTYLLNVYYVLFSNQVLLDESLILINTI